MPPAPPQPGPEALAPRIARAFAGEAVELERYATGLCHWVYRVDAASGRRFVLRVAGPGGEAAIAGGVAFTERLAELSVPVAEVLGADVDGAECGLAWMAVEWLPGRDLGQVYGELSDAEKRRLAAEVADIQQAAAALGPAATFGWTDHPDQPPPEPTWAAVLDALQADAAARARCDLYTALFALVFLSEQGMAFNRIEATVDPERVDFLERAVRRWTGPDE